MVDYLAESFDVVVRYQGGNNAGHTVVNRYGKFALIPHTAALVTAKPVYDVLAGRGCDISHVRRVEGLPQAAQDYVLYIQRALERPIS
jgi:adenylosuccinate synthase